MPKLGSSGCALAILVIAYSAAQAQQSKVGMLSCKTSASVGLVVGSQQKMSCRFTSDSGNASETYTGTINRVGLDIGFKSGGVMAWAVLASTKGLHRHALAGKYVGASGDVSIGLGAGANVLVGGSDQTVALQPLSVSGNVGVNLALGVAGLTLR